jgi:DNA-binding transcriptional MerR regulator
MSESVPVSSACDPIFYSPTEPDKISLNGQEIEIKGKQKQEIIKILLDNGVSEECIRQAISSWWKRKDPAKYLSAVKHKLKLKESAQQLQNVADELKVEKEETKEGKVGGEEKEQQVIPEQIEEEKPLVSLVTPELVGLAYGSVLEIVIAFLNIRYKKSVDTTDIFPNWEDRIKIRGETIYKALEASGILHERYIQMLILFVSVGGGIGSDIVELARFYQKSEEKEEKKTELKGKNAVENSLQLQELVKPKKERNGLLEGVLG